MSSSLVLLTGATGHLGFKVLLLALQAGYWVRVAIRKSDQKTRFSKIVSIAPYLGNVTFVVVKDITQQSAYIEAADSVDYIIHCASPIASNSKNQGESWSELFYDPAVKGTISMLKAASKSLSVKRVVITSSIFCIEGWNKGQTAGASDIIDPLSRAEAERCASRVEAYALSKIFAHAAATEYMEIYRPSFELIRITSGYIQGANELNESILDIQNGSNNVLMQVALGTITTSAKLTGQVFLDDVAKAHVVSLSPTVKTDGARTNFIIAGNGGKGIPWDEVAIEIRTQFPQEVSSGILKPVLGQESLLTSFDVALSEKALGYRFAGKQKIVKSVVSQYLALLNIGESSRLD